MLERNEPAIYKYDFEEDDPLPLKDFYLDENNVIFEEVDGMQVAYDFDDTFIMTQHDNDDTYMFNLLYARQHVRPLYERWYQFRTKYKMK